MSIVKIRPSLPREVFKTLDLERYDDVRILVNKLKHFVLLGAYLPTTSMPCMRIPNPPDPPLSRNPRSPYPYNDTLIILISASSGARGKHGDSSVVST